MRSIRDVLPITAKKLGITVKELEEHLQVYEDNLKKALKEKPYLEYDFYFLGKLRYMKYPVNRLIKALKRREKDTSHYDKIIGLFEEEYKEKAKKWGK